MYDGLLPVGVWVRKTRGTQEWTIGYKKLGKRETIVGYATTPIGVKRMVTRAAKLRDASVREDMASRELTHRDARAKFASCPPLKKFD